MAIRLHRQCFADMVQYYADRFKVYLIDFLGHGKSDRVERFASDLWHDEAMQIVTFLANVVQERELSKQDPATAQFYQFNHGEDWDVVVNNDTRAMDEHYRTISKFFHKPFDSMQVPVLFFISPKEIMQ